MGGPEIEFGAELGDAERAFAEASKDAPYNRPLEAGEVTR
jgi:hypothetical protein